VIVEKFSMKRSRFNDQQIAFALQRAEQRTQVAEVTRKMGVSEQTFYRWKKKFGGLMPSEVRKLWQLEEENVRLRRLVADLSLDKDAQEEIEAWRGRDNEPRPRISLGYQSTLEYLSGALPPTLLSLRLLEAPDRQESTGQGPLPQPIRQLPQRGAQVARKPCRIPRTSRQNIL
jgi:putative transposase